MDSGSDCVEVLLLNGARGLRRMGLTIAIASKRDDGKEELTGTKAEGNKIHQSHGADAAVEVRVCRSVEGFRGEHKQRSTEATCMEW